MTTADHWTPVEVDDLDTGARQLVYTRDGHFASSFDRHGWPIPASRTARFRVVRRLAPAPDTFTRVEVTG